MTDPPLCFTGGYKHSLQYPFPADLCTSGLNQNFQIWITHAIRSNLQSSSCII